MPAFQYALIIEFMLLDKQEYINYKFWLNDGICKENCLEIINRNRYSIGLNTSEQDNRNTLTGKSKQEKQKSQFRYNA
jgi:hypothetical protein